jgi:hypothetical protein
MPLFVCTDCGTVDDTLLGSYHEAFGIPGLGTSGRQPQCSACDPETGRWHGHFERQHWRDYHQAHPGRSLLNLRACRCGCQALEHDTALPHMPCEASGCRGYNPIPWARPC